MGRKSTLNAAAALLATLCFSAPSFAETGLYLGGSMGNAKVGYEDTDTDVDFEGDDLGYKFFGGFQFTTLAVEAAYVNFGEIEDSGLSTEVSGFSAFGKLSMGIGPVEVFGKLGGFAWESDYSDAVDAFDDSGFDPALGFGAAFNFGGFGVRGEYEFFDIGDFDKVSMFSVGATFWLL